jgi:hypothetical protein
VKSFLRISLLAACASASLLATPLPAVAQEHFTHHVFHGRDVVHFRGVDRDIWLGGHWHHEWHNGRFGWWWFAGGVWYFYDTPIYPYPTVVSDVTVVEPMAAPPPPQGTGAPMYYYCDNPAGYYPYVATCSTPFRPVPAAPPPPSAPPPGVPPAPVAH